MYASLLRHRCRVHQHRSTSPAHRALTFGCTAPNSKRPGETHAALRVLRKRKPTLDARAPRRDLVLFCVAARDAGTWIAVSTYKVGLAACVGEA